MPVSASATTVSTTSLVFMSPPTFSIGMEGGVGPHIMRMGVSHS